MSKIRITTWVKLLLGMGGAALAASMLFGGEWDTPRKIVSIMAVAFPMHVLEENALPGGYHFQYNLMWGSARPDRAPMNVCSEMLQDILLELLFLVLMLLDTPNWALHAVLMIAVLELTTHITLNLHTCRIIDDTPSLYGPGTLTCLGLFGLIVTAGLSWLSRNRLADADVIVGCAVCVIVRVMAPILLEHIVKPIPAFVYKDNGYYRFLEKVEE